MMPNKYTAANPAIVLWLQSARPVSRLAGLAPFTLSKQNIPRSSNSLFPRYLRQDFTCVCLGGFYPQWREAAVGRVSPFNF